MRLLFALALTVVVSAGRARADAIDDLEGRPITSIEIESSIRLDEASLRAEIPLHLGSPLRRSALDAAAEWLRAKEVFESVEVEAIGDEVGVRVRFRTRPLDYLVAIEFRGAQAIPVEDLRRRSRLREGGGLQMATLEEAKRRIVELYASHGYPRATADASVARVAESAVRLRFRLTEGEPQRLDHVEIHSSGGVSPETLRTVLPFAPGDVWSSEALEMGEDALRRWLRGEGYFECEVSSSESVTGPRVVPRYAVVTGERFELVVEGNHSIDRRALLEVLDLESRPIITAGTWREMARRMRRRHQEEGFPFAAVGVETRGNNPREVVFRVAEGPTVHVSAIRVSGNRKLSDRRIRGTMETRPASAWPFGDRGVFVDDVFADDLERIRERYRAEGYLAARIIDVRFALDSARGDLVVTIVIAEGKRSRLGSINVRSESLLGERIGPFDSLRSGEPYRVDRVEDERVRLQDRVRSLGHPDARVMVDTTIRRDEAAGEQVDIGFVVHPGPEVKIGRVVVQRNFYTRDAVIRRELDLGTGDRLDPSALLEAQRRLYRLGLFRSASVSAAESDGPVRDVYLRVAERPAGELQYGFGYHTSTGVRNFAQLAHRNLAGTGRALTLRGELNLSRADFTPDEYLADLGGRWPRLVGDRWDGRSNIVLQHSEREVDEFSIDRFAVSSGLEREILPKLQGSILVELDDSRIFDVAPDAVLTGQDEGRLRTVSLNPILVFDGRDDAFAPKSGVFESIRLRYAARAFGSDVGFVKLTGQHSHYVPLPSGLSWIYSARAGIAEVIEGASSVPLRERFFLGGRTTVRGFDENEIGPRGDDGNPTGGDLSINLNTELRFPLLFGMGGAVFVDAGALYLREQAVTLNEFREAAGPGLRYQTPIGSVGLDYGFKLDRRGGESIGEVHFSIGNLF